MANIDVNSLDDINHVAFGRLSHSLLLHTINWHEFHNSLREYASYLAFSGVTHSSKLNRAKLWLSDYDTRLSNLATNSSSSRELADNFKYLYEVNLYNSLIFIPNAFSTNVDIRSNAKPVARGAGSDNDWHRENWHKYLDYWFSRYYESALDSIK